MLASRNLNGSGSGGGLSCRPFLGADGQTVVFQSWADDLAIGDANQHSDILMFRLGGRDSDGDGLDDDWELAFFNTLDRNGTGDFDGDGATDSAEFRAGTDPTNQGSVLRVLTVTQPGGGMYRALARRRYVKSTGELDGVSAGDCCYRAKGCGARLLIASAECVVASAEDCHTRDRRDGRPTGVNTA